MRPIRSSPAGSADGSAGEQGAQQSHRHRRLRLDVEALVEGAAAEQAADIGEHEAGGERRIEGGDRLAIDLGGLDEVGEAGYHLGVVRPHHPGDARIAARLGGDFEEHHRLVARLVEQVVAQHRLEHAEHVAAGGEGVERGAALALVEQADALDQGLLGREIAVEVAGAHARLFRHLLHRRGVEAVADEGALGGDGDVIRRAWSAWRSGARGSWAERSADRRSETGAVVHEFSLRMNVHSK